VEDAEEEKSLNAKDAEDAKEIDITPDAIPLRERCFASLGTQNFPRRDLSSAYAMNR